MRLVVMSGAMVVAFCVAGGCAKTDATESAGGAASPLAESVLTQTKPEGALPVVESREKSKDGDEVVVIGQVGGEEKPFVDGVAVFSLVDLSLPACTEGCPTPWDFCCDTDKFSTHKMLVKVVDGDGKPIATDARELLAIKELSRVVVKGKSQRDEAGNMTVLATTVFVERP